MSRSSTSKSAPPVEQDAEVMLYPEIQTSRCQAARYRANRLPQCIACIRRQGGEGCRFIGVRVLLRDGGGKLAAISFPCALMPEPPDLEFPTKWNVQLLPEHIRVTKTAVAKALLPTLRLELQHLSPAEVIHRPRESQFRATCDTCMTSIFSSSWMCRRCGRETCLECFDEIKELSPQTQPQHPNSHFLLCVMRTVHTAVDFSPVSRFSKAELEAAIREMEELVLEDKQVGPAMNGQVVGSNGQSLATPPPLNLHRHDTHAPNIPSHATRRYTEPELTDNEFDQVWALGEPIVVTGLLSRFEVLWTPEFFIHTYGSESCFIVECQTGVIREVTVGKFFSSFGKYEERKDCWKLKDWPPSADFKSTFPELYRDFSQAVPVPNYVRRDGVLNISSHFPTNTVVPDLGPKMYNALCSSERAGSQGTTKLHMDVADALNIMVHAEVTPEGRPGCAAWDLFRAEDSDKLRQFLRGKYPKDAAGNCTVASWHDPIHSQEFFLDEVLRAELFETMGVKSHRVYQRPGEAVFIPAGCAHQVCNLSDCIKVASDFVSPHNIARCEKLTKEFREQNYATAWKEDVLQLRTMMWFAWLSCSTHQRSGEGRGRKREH